MERPRRRGAGRLVWLALGALVVAAPVWLAVRGSPRAHAPRPRDRAAPGGAPPQARAGPSPVRVHVEPPKSAEPGQTGSDPHSATAEPARVAAPATDRAQGERPGAAPEPVPGAEQGPAPEAAPATADVAAESGAGGPEQDLAHVKLWSATFAGGRALARASASPDGLARSHRMRTIAEILRPALVHGALSPAPDAETSVSGMRARALAGEGSVALWVLAPGEGWGDPVERAKVTVRGLEPGRWRVTWLDDVSGAEIASEERDVDADAELAVPTFARHVAAILERADTP